VPRVARVGAPRRQSAPAHRRRPGLVPTRRDGPRARGRGLRPLPRRAERAGAHPLRLPHRPRAGAAGGAAALLRNGGSPPSGHPRPGGAREADEAIRGEPEEGSGDRIPYVGAGAPHRAQAGDLGLTDALRTVAVSMGDPAGIGAEVLCAALHDAEVSRRVRAVVFGDSGIWAEACERMGVPDHLPRVRLGDPLPAQSVLVEVARLGGPDWGRPSPEGGRAQKAYLEAALDLVKAGG